MGKLLNLLPKEEKVFISSSEYLFFKVISFFANELN